MLFGGRVSHTQVGIVDVVVDVVVVVFGVVDCVVDVDVGVVGVVVVESCC